MFKFCILHSSVISGPRIYNEKPMFWRQKGVPPAPLNHTTLSRTLKSVLVTHERMMEYFVKHSSDKISIEWREWASLFYHSQARHHPSKQNSQPATVPSVVDLPPTPSTNKVMTIDEEHVLFPTELKFSVMFLNLITAVSTFLRQTINKRRMTLIFYKCRSLQILFFLRWMRWAVAQPHQRPRQWIFP